MKATKKVVTILSTHVATPRERGTHVTIRAMFGRVANCTGSRARALELAEAALAYALLVRRDGSFGHRDDDLLQRLTDALARYDGRARKFNAHGSLVLKGDLAF